LIGQQSSGCGVRNSPRSGEVSDECGVTAG